MRGTDLETGKAIERPFENQMRQGNRGFKWIANRVGQ